MLTTSATATAGASGTNVGLAGSLALNIVSNTSEASVPSGTIVNSSTVASPATVGLSVQAINNETLRNIAFTVATGSEVGAGAAIDVNVVNNPTNAFLDSGVKANVADATQIAASAGRLPKDLSSTDGKRRSMAIRIARFSPATASNSWIPPVSSSPRAVPNSQVESLSPRCPAP